MACRWGAGPNLRNVYAGVSILRAFEFAGGFEMMDLAFVGLGAVLFALTWALVHGFERLRKR